MKNVSNTQFVEMFQVEELEERLESCWGGQKWQDQGYTDNSGVYHENWVKVSCDAPEYVAPNYSVQ